MLNEIVYFPFFPLSLVRFPVCPFWPSGSESPLFPLYPFPPVLYRFPFSLRSFVFDVSGTEVVEIGELALKIKQLLHSEAEIVRGALNKETTDRYLGSSQEYTDLIRKLEISPHSLKDQILCTALYLKR